VLYASLVLALALRGGATQLSQFWENYFWPFTFLYVMWVAALFINDFYSPRHWRVNVSFFQALAKAMLVNALAAVVFFYVNYTLGIAPKTNLALLVLISTALFTLWRFLAAKFMVAPSFREPVVFLEVNDHSIEMVAALAADPASPWRVAGIICSRCALEGETLNEVPMHKDISVLPELVANHGVRTIIVGNLAFRDIKPLLYDLMLSGVAIRDAASFWEDLHSEVPMSTADADWFLASFSDVRRGPYDAFKRILDLSLAVFLVVCFWWLMALIAIGVKLTSPGPILYRQKRVGRHGRVFTLYKFRTMVADAEKEGAQWATKGDQRATKFGRILRHSHLDEFPQLWNIFRGEMSFFGPRPERPEFVEQLKLEIPFYSLRHLVKPGISGWAQINYRYGSSVEDARRKLAYDLYYIKRRSPFLDIQIGLKTLAMFFRGEGR